MSYRKTTNSRHPWRGRVLALSWLLAAFGCREEVRETPTDGETHFLKSCEADPHSCGTGLACLCGVCTQACTENASCEALSTAAECVGGAERSSADLCSEDAASAVCDVPCSGDLDCSAVAALPYCVGGFCRPLPASPANASGGATGTGGSSGISAGGGNGGSSGAAGASGAAGRGGAGGTAGDGGAGGVAGTSGAGGDGCPPSSITGNEVVILGDMFIATNHDITANLETLARRAGALADTERYRDYSTVGTSGLVIGAPLLADHYATAKAEGDVRVVVMDAGGPDLLIGACESPVTTSCPIIADVATAADTLLSQMTADEVDVVWFYYPDPADATLRAKVDVARPLLQAVCERPEYRCHWIDLREWFDDPSITYLATDTVPTGDGALATADAIWSTMRANCIAQ